MNSPSSHLTSAATSTGVAAIGMEMREEDPTRQQCSTSTMMVNCNLLLLVMLMGNMFASCRQTSFTAGLDGFHLLAGWMESVVPASVSNQCSRCEALKEDLHS